MDTTTEESTFAWSYSRLNDFEVCPRRYAEKGNWEKDKPRSPHLEHGDAVHTAMANTLRTGAALPPQFAVYQHWIDKINRTPGELFVEEQCRFALTRELTPTVWFGSDVWVRAIADALKVDDDVALVVDHKTGKSTNAGPLQLELLSLIVMAVFPRVDCVRADFIFLNENYNVSKVVHRHELADRWAKITPRVKTLEQATQENKFPPKPGRFCARWCPVQSCEYWGRG